MIAATVCGDKVSAGAVPNILSVGFEDWHMKEPKAVEGTPLSYSMFHFILYPPQKTTPTR
jgi:hypothetical protein